MSADTTKRPAAPAGLDKAGRAFWRSVTSVYMDLMPAELELLAQAGRTVDTIAALEAAVAADGLMLDGSKGQPVLNPAVTEARLQRAQLGKLLDQLGLPVEDETGQPMVGQGSAKTRAARKAAHVRWGTGKYAS